MRSKSKQMELVGRLKGLGQLQWAVLRIVQMGNARCSNSSVTAWNNLPRISGPNGSTTEAFHCDGHP